MLLMDLTCVRVENPPPLSGRVSLCAIAMSVRREHVARFVTPPIAANVSCRNEQNSSDFWQFLPTLQMCKPLKCLPDVRIVILRRL